jgi:transcriptional regulator with XRE-family HTH domain
MRYKVGLCELARALQISPSYLSRIENGQERPSERILEAYAVRFRLDLDEMSRLAGIVPRDIRRHLVTSPHALRMVRQAMADGG